MSIQLLFQGVLHLMAGEPKPASMVQGREPVQLTWATTIYYSSWGLLVQHSLCGHGIQCSDPVTLSASHQVHARSRTLCRCNELTIFVLKISLELALLSTRGGEWRPWCGFGLEDGGLCTVLGSWLIDT